MSRFTAIATAVALLVHIVAGCCLHHAHAEAPDQLAAAAEAGCCGDHLHGPAGSEERESPNPNHCDEDSCVVVASDPVHLPSLADSFACWGGPESLQAADDHTASFERHSDRFLRPPSTLFELHQILLI